MIIKAYNTNHEYLLFIDLEFFNKKEGDISYNHLIQFAGLLFKRIDTNTYQLMRSYNSYVTDTVCYPFWQYTSISDNFLAENGIPLEDMIYGIEETFLDGIDLSKVLLISHGLKNDRLILEDSGIFLYKNEDEPIDGYCTFTNARRILERDNHLTLGDLCEECGYYLHQAHNAYNDVWGEVAVFTYLKKLEEQKKGDE